MGKVMRYLFIIIVIAIVGFAIYKGIESKNKEKKEELKEKKIEQENTVQKDLRLAISELDTFNPYKSNNRNVQEISKLFYDSLLTFDQNYNLKLELAKDIQKIDDKNYRAIITENAKFSDGTDITSKDIEFSVQQVIAGNNPYKEITQNIVSTTIENDKSIIFTLKEPKKDFEYYLNFPITKKIDIEVFNDKNRYPIPVQSGKYWFKEMKNTTAIYVVNTNYYNQDFKPIINEIYVTTYNSMGEIYNAFKAGNVDIITTNLNNAQEYIGTEGYERIDIKGRDFHFLSLNNQKIGLEDRKKITEGLGINQVISGLGVIYSGYPLDYGTSQYSGTVLNNQDEVDKEKDFKNINRNMIVNESNNLQVQMAERIIEQLNKKGAKIKLTKLKADRYYKQIETKDYDMAIVGIRQSYIPDISRILGIAGTEDAGITEILNKLKNLWIDSKSNLERKELLKQLEQKLKEIYSFIPLARETKKAYISSSLIVGQNFEGITNFNMFTNIAKWYRK